MQWSIYIGIGTKRSTCDFNLLGLEKSSEHLDLLKQKSSLQDWQKRSTNKFKVKRTTDRIRKEILKRKTANWGYFDRVNYYKNLVHQAFIYRQRR